MKKYHWRFIPGRNKNDVEKAVLPTILYINPNHEAFKEDRLPGFMIILGWWDFSLKFGLIISEYHSHTHCGGNCGMNYCDENGCSERTRVLTDPCSLNYDSPPTCHV